MYLQRLFQINVATLAALGAVLLGMGTRDAVLPLLILIAAIGSVWLTDFTGWFRLNRTVANIAALVVVVISLSKVHYFGGDAQILGISKLLVYLQIILLFQEKDARTYWQLITLSLLEVVIAAVFSQGIWFGVLLVVYMLVGLSGLTLLFMHRQWNRYRSAGRLPSAPAAGARWPLAGLEPTLASTPAGRDRSGIGVELFGRLGMMGLGTLMLTGLLFFSVPRFGRTAWRGAVRAPRRLVGFSDTVTLGELGKIIESREEVMRVQLTGEDTGRPYPVQGELYLRGAILTHYRGGQWSHPTTRRRRLVRLARTQRPPEHRRVLQEITALPLDRDELCCIWPFVPMPSGERLLFDPDRRQILRPRRRRTGWFTFQLGTTAFADGVQVPLVPCDPRDGLLDTRPLVQLPELPELTKLAESWVRQSGLPADDRIGQARYLQRRFHDPERFQYSLEGQKRDWNLDPIEDFIANNPQGHCEYFATALALMLRSQGIPSRVVVGYKSGEFNRLGKFYQVRQLHAHTWVEAYLEPRHVPPELFDAPAPWRWAAGAWLRLEPTPAAEAAEALAGAAVRERIERAMHWLQSLWADYVLEMDRSRQREAVYRPIKNAIRRLRDPDWWRGLLSKAGEALNLTGAGGRAWLWLALMLLLGLPALMLTGYWLWRFSRRAWRPLAAGAALPAKGQIAKVEFYRRLELLLARHGLTRRPGQTAREFAAAAGSKIAATTGQARLVSLPARVVEAYYRVRFGRLPLDRLQQEAVEHALSDLAACGLADVRAAPGKPGG